MEKSINNEIMKILEFFQAGYTKRNVNGIDGFMDELFDKDESATILGTSNGEWCLSYEEVKELFLSDWQYWGDLRLKAEEAVIRINRDAALIYVPAVVSQGFKESKERDARYLGGVKSYFEEGYSNFEKPLKIRLTEINWTLSHLLHQRDTDERKYWLNLRVSFVLTRKSGRWIIRHIQFSYPSETQYPDERIFEGSGIAEVHEEDLKKIRAYSNADKYGRDLEIKALLNRFKSEFLNTDKPNQSFVSEFFSEDALFVNTDNNISRSHELIVNKVNINRKILSGLEFDAEDTVINSEGDTSWVAACGIIKDSISEEEACRRTAARIQDIFESSVPDREKLFRIRREIASTLKETAVGAEYAWPVRFEGLLIKEDNKLRFAYMQLSYPFYWILEGKTNADTVEVRNEV